MINERTGKDITVTTLPPLTGNNNEVDDARQVYIYILLNEEERIKIGQTKNPVQRFQALSGSNGQGIKIVKAYISEPTYLHTMEEIMHVKYSEYRIPHTEWFTGSDLDFQDVVQQLNLLFCSDEYRKCNELRRAYM